MRPDAHFDTYAAASARTSPGADITSIIFCALLAMVGFALAFNLKDSADRFYEVTSKMTLGFVGSATPKTLRFVGGGVAALGTTGVIVELVAGLT
ncbi:hypothetical protein AB0O07_18885 [Streptomyces sp. NPDC093085]|uniref:hypothetical protein n=1 Tax=Streptomyces sp. NPDC093085 TaxID=3155068 RepID=UPI00341F8DB7